MSTRSEAPPVVPGFRSGGIHCGIKPGKSRDLAMIVSEVPAAVAGVTTQSTVVGAPVELTRERLRSGSGRGLVVNSGISNVAMGARGRRDARAMATSAARAVGCAASDFYVASTGVIGEPLPMPLLGEGIPRLAAKLAPEGLPEAAEAIMTTDTFAKLACVRATIGGKRVTLAGIAKGSGMIEPNMATMLGFLLTDAAVSPSFLRTALRRSVAQTFNCLSIDGESSTSDTVLLFANGVAGNAKLRGPSSPGADRFEEALREVSESLVRDLARDGEGATKLIRVDVRGAASAAQADRAARRIANSPLVKTAVFGSDPNWGRILQTVGAAQVAIRLDRAIVKLCGIAVFRNGASAGPAARKRAAAKHSGDEIQIEVELGAGSHAAHMWTCDYSYEYIRINAEYTT
jgi:glutamate N-acetyltransferase/amino-acid N-acetyltransferase